MKDYEKMVNCNDTYCEYFDERMELNCAYSEDNSECIKTIEPLSSHAVLDDVVKLLTEYTQYLYKFGYLDDDWIMEASSPIQEFINKKFGNVV